MERLKKLVDLKTIVTIMLTCVFCYMTVKRAITPTEFLTIFTVVISFYFNRSKNKEAGNE